MHGARRRRAAALVPAPVAAVNGAEITTVEGIGTPEQLGAVQAGLPRALRLAVRLLHARASCSPRTRCIERAPEASRDGDRDGARRPRLPLHRLREDPRRGRAAVAARLRPDDDAGSRRPRSCGSADEGRRRTASALRRRRARHRADEVRRRRPRPEHALGEGAALARPPRRRSRASTRPRPRRCRASTRSSRWEDVPLPRLRAPRRRSASPPTSRCSRRTSVRYKGQPIARRRRRGRGDGAGGGRGDRDRLRGAARALRRPPGGRPGRAADPPLGQLVPALRGRDGPCGRSARATSTRPSTQADMIVTGVYRPAAIEHCPLETQICARRPRAERPADDLLVHAGAVLLDGRRRRAPRGAAEQAQVRRRHGRRRLRRQGRHGDRDDLRARSR